MDYPRFCGCKGCRTCLLCESKLGIQEKGFYQQFKDKTAYTYCPHCDALYPGWDTQRVLGQHPQHTADDGQTPVAPLAFPGVHILPDFLSASEEHDLMLGIDQMPWQTSQSGRRKQNFGPKTNFKKMKLQCGTFAGFPAFSRFVQQRFTVHPLLSTFRTIEQCSLEYDATKGASIDPHIDDCWIWGERIVTVSCLSDSVLTLTPFTGDRARYNLPQVDRYRDRLLAEYGPDDELQPGGRWSDAVIRLPMPARSLMVLFGPARYQWEHCVLREDVEGRRVCVAYREFTPPYLPVADEEGATNDELRKGAEVLAQAERFWDHLDDGRWSSAVTSNEARTVTTSG